MSMSAEAEIVSASVKALEHHEAAWQAYDRETGPPDPAALPDRTLQAIMQFEKPDLPHEAFEAVEAESRRRGLSASMVDRAASLALLILLGISGVVVFGFLLSR